MESVVTHILPLTLIQRSRILPMPGKVLVSVGQKVGASDIIAEAALPGRHVMVDVRRELGLSRIDETEKLIQVSGGSRIGQNDIIAQIGGLLTRSVRAPAAGMVITVSAGRVMIETESVPLQVRAGFAGTVVDVFADRGAIVETSGSLLQGRIGSGQVDQGTLLVIAHSADDELVAAQLDPSMRGAVLAAGHCGQADVLRSAGELSLRGLILSSISADLLPLVKAAQYPIIVLEGIGKLPYSPQAYQLLTTHDKREVSMDASVYDPVNGIRPEIIVPLPGAGEQAADAVEFTPGKTVRLLAAPYASQTGTLVQVRSGKTRLKNGVHTQVGDVHLPNMETVTVPLANLEVLE